MKRFTEALKWRDPWFRGLSIDGKLVFFYLVDNCDAAGVWEPDFQLANFCLKRDVDWDSIRSEFGDRLAVLGNGKWWLRKFIEFQYGRLTEKCAPHRTIISLVLKHGFQLVDGTVTLPLPYQYPPPRVQEKEKEKEEDKEKEKEKDKTRQPDLFSGSVTSAPSGTEFPKSDLQRRAEKLFNRRETTVWDGSECKAWDRSRAAIAATAEEDWLLLEWYYSLPQAETYRRRDLATLLNNWGAEIDRARAHKAGGGKPKSGPGASWR